MNNSTLFSTFYSFKGGVGRTLTLVNTAVLLTQKGHSVVLWDMDIEAPGIQNIPYFKPLRRKIKGGFVDIAADFRESGYKRLNPERFSRYLVKHPKNDRLSLLPAGKTDERDYSHKYALIPWDKLFGKERTAG